MVQNHSQKKQARMLMGENGSQLTLTQAMARVEEIRSQGKKAQSRFSTDAHRSTFERIAEEIRLGQDILIFGMTGSGKTSVLSHLVHWAKLKTLLLMGFSGEAIYSQGLLADDCEVRPANQPLPEDLSGLELICFDDLRSDLQWPQLDGFTGSRIATIHGSNIENAAWRSKTMFPSLGLKSPMVIETKMVRDADSKSPYRLDLAIRSF